MNSKVLLLLILLGFSFECGLKAQDIIVRKDKTLIKAIVDEITPSEVIYRDFGNPQGPQMRMHKSYIQKIQYQNGFEEEIRVSAVPPKGDNNLPEQQDPSQEMTEETPENPGNISSDEYFLRKNASLILHTPMRYRHKGGDFFLGSMMLSDVEMSYLIGDTMYQEIYIPSQRKRRLGMSFLIAGGCSLGVGSMLMAVGGIDHSARFIFIPGGILMGTGGALLTAGAVLYAQSKKSLTGIESEYNASRGFAYQISAGMTPYGLGLAFQF